MTKLIEPIDSAATRGARKQAEESNASLANSRQVGGEHYKTGGDEHWDLFGLDYLIGYATKYMRWRKKGGVQDLEKAIHVIEKIKEVMVGRPWPDYDGRRVVAWCENMGLDWCEKTVVIYTMLSSPNKANDLDCAIAGIRYLIERERKTEEAPVSAGHVNYATLDKCSSVALELEKTRLEDLIKRAPGWGAALTAYDESLKAINAEITKRQRRVPRHVPDTPSCGDGNFDRRMQRLDEERLTLGDPTVHVDAPRTPEDGGQHASLYPWVVGKQKLQDDPRRAHLSPFYKPLGTVRMVLDAFVDNHAMPVELQKFYEYNSDAGGWVIVIDKVPADAREWYPSLQREMNSQEWEESPRWQHRLYVWQNGKYVLRNEAWGRE